MFDCLSTLLGLLPFRSVWVVGGNFNAEVGYRGVGEDSTLGTTKVLFEDALGESWSAYTEHNPVEVRLAKGWIYLRRPNWVALRGSSDGPVLA